MMKLFIALLVISYIASVSHGKVLFEDNFTTFDPKHGTKWMHFGTPANPGDDGTAKVSAHGAELKAQPYTKQYKPLTPLSQEDFGGFGELGRTVVTPKAQLTEDPLSFPVGPEEKLTLTTTFNVGISGTHLHPFGDNVTNHSDDPRLSSCGLAILDLETALATCVFLTNEAVWTWHDRFGYPGIGGTADSTPPERKFVNWKRSSDRKVDDWHTMQVEYNRKEGKITWRELPSGKIHRVVDTVGLLREDDGVNVFEFNHDPCTEPDTVDPDRFIVFWGCVVEMDKIDPNHNNCAKNRADGKKKASNCYTDEHLASGLIRYVPKEYHKVPTDFMGNLHSLDWKNFGQGGNMTMSHIKVEVTPA